MEGGCDRMEHVAAVREVCDEGEMMVLRVYGCRAVR